MDNTDYLTPTIMTSVIASCCFVLLTISSIAVCRCRRMGSSKKSQQKISSGPPISEYDMENGRSSLTNAVNVGQQLPLPQPPLQTSYHSTSGGGLDGKSHDHSQGLELSLTVIDDHHLNDDQHILRHTNSQKPTVNPFYGSQNGYTCHMVTAMGIEGDNYQIVSQSAKHRSTTTVSMDCK